MPPTLSEPSSNGYPTTPPGRHIQKARLLVRRGLAQVRDWDLRTGARSDWINAQGAPQDGYPAALNRLAPDWREHLARA